MHAYCHHVQAFIQREHEFRFVAVEPETLEGERMGRLAVRHRFASMHHHTDARQKNP